jgi:hypothetical protein
MKFRGDDRELLRGLWSVVQSAGGSPSINMIQKMARLAGASFDDKAARAVLFGDAKNTEIAEVSPQFSGTFTEATPRHDTGNNATSDRKSTDSAKVPPQHSGTFTEVPPWRDAKNITTNSRKTMDDAEAQPQFSGTFTEVTPKCGFGENDENTVFESPAPNLFDGLGDRSELEPVNNVATLVPADGADSKEGLAPGIARLMELSKRAKAVNAAAAMRSAAKAAPNPIRYIFPSERKPQ